MRRTGIILSGLTLFAFAAFSRAQTPQSFRILLGVTDQDPTRWTEQ